MRPAALSKFGGAGPTKTFKIKETAETKKITVGDVRAAVENVTCKTVFDGTKTEAVYADLAIKDVTKLDCVSAVDEGAGDTPVTEAKVFNNTVTITLDKTKYSPAGPGWTIAGSTATVDTTVRVNVYKKAVSDAFAYTFPKEIKYTYNKENAKDRTFDVDQIAKYLNDDGDEYEPEEDDVQFRLNKETSPVVVFGDGNSADGTKAGAVGSTDWLVNADDLHRLSYASANTKMDLRLTLAFNDGKTVDYAAKFGESRWHRYC